MITTILDFALLVVIVGMLVSVIGFWLSARRTRFRTNAETRSGEMLEAHPLEATAADNLSRLVIKLNFGVQTAPSSTLPTPAATRLPAAPHPRPAPSATPQRPDDPAPASPESTELVVAPAVPAEMPAPAVYYLHHNDDGHAEISSHADRPAPVAADIGQLPLPAMEPATDAAAGEAEVDVLPMGVMQSTDPTALPLRPPPQVKPFAVTPAPTVAVGEPARRSPPADGFPMPMSIPAQEESAPPVTPTEATPSAPVEAAPPLDDGRSEPLGTRVSPDSPIWRVADGEPDVAMHPGEMELLRACDEFLRRPVQPVNTTFPLDPDEKALAVFSATVWNDRQTGVRVHFPLESDRAAFVGMRRRRLAGIGQVQEDGSLIVTNRRLLFAGPSVRLSFPYGLVGSIDLFADALRVRALADGGRRLISVDNPPLVLLAMNRAYRGT